MALVHPGQCAQVRDHAVRACRFNRLAAVVAVRHRPDGLRTLFENSLNKQLPQKINVKYQGTLKGGAVSVHITRVPEGVTVGLLESSGYQNNALLILDARTIRVMEESGDKNATFHELTRQPGGE